MGAGQDAAAKWEVVMKRFAEHGDLPNETETEAAVNEASAEYWDAKAELAKVYDAVIKDLTRQQQIATAKSVREELRMQQSRNCDPVRLRNLQKEFEATGDRGGWEWLKGDSTQQSHGGVEGMYSICKDTREITYHFERGGKVVVISRWSPTYEVIGVDEHDENIVLIEMTYPPEQGKPTEKATFRFNRKTGCVDSPFGFFARPIRRRSREPLP